jgi:hypothetical protein
MIDEADEKSKAKGGFARAEALSPEERTEIAKQGAAARWDPTVPRASHYGNLILGDITIPCAVLPDGTRLITQRGMFVALGRHKNPSQGPLDSRPAFLGANNLSPFISPELERSWAPIRFRMPSGSGGARGNIAYGYDARILPHVCNVFLDAKDANALQQSQVHIAATCKVLQRGFATVGIIALIDEATGYQEVRDRDALRQILEAYLRQELAAWVKRFPDEFYKEIYRLRNWPWPGMGKNRYSAVAGYTKDLIYERLAPGVLEEMEKRNPKDEKGHRKGKHHQLLSEDLGIPKLQEHFAAVLALLRAHDSWDEFYAKMQRSLPKRDDIPLLQYGESRSTAA